MRCDRLRAVNLLSGQVVFEDALPVCSVLYSIVYLYAIGHRVYAVHCRGALS